jgi:hypothetical protein
MDKRWRPLGSKASFRFTDLNEAAAAADATAWAGTKNFHLRGAWLYDAAS